MILGQYLELFKATPCIFPLMRSTYLSEDGLALALTMQRTVSGKDVRFDLSSVRILAAPQDSSDFTHPPLLGTYSTVTCRGSHACQMGFGRLDLSGVGVLLWFDGGWLYAIRAQNGPHEEEESL